MTVNIIQGLRKQPPEPGDKWVEHKPNGNFIVEFVHPSEKEREALHQLIRTLTAALND